MNKKLVAFLLSTGILVSTCGTAFANEVALDQPIVTVNTEAPPINDVVNAEDQITNDIANIPAPPAPAPLAPPANNPVNTGCENTKPIPEKPEEPKAEEVKEEVKDVELPPFPVSGDMQKEIDQLLKDCRAEYEKILSNVNNVKNTETSRQSGRLIDKYNEQVIDIHKKYYNIYKENSNILGDLYLKLDIKDKEYFAEMDKYDKYLREIDNMKQEAWDDLDRIDEEYRDKIDKAYEALDKKTTNTTSTVSETGSRIGSSSIDSSDFDSIPSSTSISRLGTSNPKTGDYTTLGASIATMIAGIAGIFVSRKR